MKFVVVGPRPLGTHIQRDMGTNVDGANTRVCMLTHAGI